MMDYNYTGNFGAAPLGPFTSANKKLVWADGNASLAQDFDPNGKWYEIVADDRFPNGRACRMKFGKGRVGMQDQSYQVKLPSPRTVANIEFLWLFEAGFAFYNEDVANNTSGNGKLGPCIQWGPVGGSVDRGTRCMWWWNANGSNHAHPVLSPSCQDQETGNQHIQPIRDDICLEMVRILSVSDFEQDRQNFVVGGRSPDSHVSAAALTHAAPLCSTASPTSLNREANRMAICSFILADRVALEYGRA
jgi:hypothetical protein